MAAINFTYCMQGATRTFPSGNVTRKMGNGKNNIRVRYAYLKMQLQLVLIFLVRNSSLTIT